MRKKKEITDDEYYGEIVERCKAFKNKDFLQEFLIDTEPKGERPTHSRIVSIATAEASQSEFFKKMYQLIAKNSRKEWMPVTDPEISNFSPLPDHTKELQPLGYFAIGSQVPSI